MSDTTPTPKSEINLDEYRQRTDRGKRMTLQQAAEMQGISKARMRSLAAATDSSIISWKETPEGLGIKVAYVFEQDVRDFFANRPARKSSNGAGGGTRTPGAKSYVVKLTDEQVAAFREAFPEAELADRYNYDPAKSKAYRDQKKAKGLAELQTQHEETQKATRRTRRLQEQEPENQPEPEGDALTSQLDELLSQ